MNGILIRNTVLVGGCTTLMALCLGIAAALVLVSASRPVRHLLLGAALTTLALPPFLVTNAWMRYLGTAGAWRDWFPLDLFTPAGAVLILSLWLWPVTAVIVWGSWQRLEPAHLEVEPMLKGGAFVRHILAPMAVGPALVAACITFILAANNLSVPALLQVNVYPAAIWTSFSSTFWMTADGHFDWRTALALMWPVVLLPLTMVLIVQRRALPWPSLRIGTPPRLVRRTLGWPWVGSACVVTLMILCGSVGVPLWEIAGDSRTWAQLPSTLVASRSAIFNSLGLAILVPTLCVGGTLLLVLRSARQERWWRATLSLAWIPFLIPGVLIGIALIQSLNRPPVNWLYPSFAVVILALTIRYAVVGLSLARHAVRAADRDLSDAARLEGATPLQLARHVFWPQLAPQLAAAWAIIFLLCLWDVETMVLIVPPGGETVALRVFNLLHYGHTAHVNAHCLILLALALAPLCAAGIITRIRRRSTATGRSRGVAVWAALVVALIASAGCSPGTSSRGVRVDSRFFDRVEIIATRGVAPGQVNKPRSVTVDQEDNLFVLDFTGRVQKFSSDGEFLLLWQMPETERGKPKGLSIDPAGNLIVVEPHYSRVNVFTTQGDLLMQSGVKGTNDGQFSFPRAAVVNKAGDWFVSEFGVVDRIQRFTVQDRPLADTAATPDATAEEAPRRLQFVAAYGRAGSGPGEFNRPEGLCVDGPNRLLIADAVNHRIQKLTAEGQVLGMFGTVGHGPGELNYPYDICADREGRYYVCEFGNSRIQVFNESGESLEILGGAGAAPGMFNNPWGVALDSQGNLYVADSQNHRVQKFIRKSGQTLQGSGRGVRKAGRVQADARGDHSLLAAHAGLPLAAPSTSTRTLQPAVHRPPSPRAL